MNWNGVSDKKQKIERDTTKLADKLLRKKAGRVGLKTKAVFMMMRMMQKANMMSGEDDRAYWEKQGWLEKERPWNMQ